MFFDAKTTAKLIGVSEVSLYFWRRDGKGPPYREMPSKRGGYGRRYEYPAREVMDWSFARRAQPLIDRIAALEGKLAKMEGASNG